METRIVKQDINYHFLFRYLELLGGMSFNDGYVADTIKSLMRYVDYLLTGSFTEDIVDEYVACVIEQPK